MNNKEYIENFLRNYALSSILDYETGIRQTSDCVWGKDVRRIYKENNEYQIDRNELEDWYIKFSISPNIDDGYLNNLVQQLKKQCYEKDCGDIPIEERQNYTCYQLCNWRFLENEHGFILNEHKNLRNEVVSYTGTLVKYGIILKDYEVEE